MASDADSIASRRRARGAWKITRHELGQDPGDDLSDATTPADRIRMMKALAESAWRIAGKALPEYDRHSMPSRLFERGEPRPENDEP